VKYFIAFLVSFVLISCGGSRVDTTESGGLEQDINQSTKKVDLQVFFSKTSGAYYDGGVDNNITDDINSAKC